MFSRLLCHRRRHAHRHAPYRAIIVIPARNESERIRSCLQAIAQQTALKSISVAVLVLVNGTSDATYEDAVDFAQSASRMDVHVVDASLPAPRQDAGAARQWATRLACTLPARQDTAVFMTDADSVVPPDWLQRYGELLWSRHYDAVAGGVCVQQDDPTQLPHSFEQRAQWEQHYETLLDRLEAQIDACPWNPWPRHYQASGANIAIHRSLVRLLLGSPWPACGEDKALITAALARDCRVRHDTEVRVATSGRLFGRARGGMADTIRHRILEPDLPCDPRLEAADRAYFRAHARRTWRRVHGQAAAQDALAAFAQELGLPLQAINQALRMRYAGASWQWLETVSPHLARAPLVPHELPHQLARAETLLAQEMDTATPAATAAIAS